ncbi:MAG: glycosyltransferase [Clostridia bacterium]|nr:glycosyltransferase [Clostridia bacterium]
MKRIFIIPAFNEAEILPSLIAEVREKAPDFDYVIINDGSTDLTREVCRDHQFNAIHLQCDGYTKANTYPHEWF